MSVFGSDPDIGKHLQDTRLLYLGDGAAILIRNVLERASTMGTRKPVRLSRGLLRGASEYCC